MVEKHGNRLLNVACMMKAVINDVGAIAAVAMLQDGKSIESSYSSFTDLTIIQQSWPPARKLVGLNGIAKQELRSDLERQPDRTPLLDALDLA